MGVPGREQGMESHAKQPLQHAGKGTGPYLHPATLIRRERKWGREATRLGVEGAMGERNDLLPAGVWRRGGIGAGHPIGTALPRHRTARGSGDTARLLDASCISGHGLHIPLPFHWLGRVSLSTKAELQDPEDNKALLWGTLPGSRLLKPGAGRTLGAVPNTSALYHPLH